MEKRSPRAATIPRWDPARCNSVRRAATTPPSVISPCSRIGPATTRRLATAPCSRTRPANTTTPLVNSPFNPMRPSVRTRRCRRALYSNVIGNGNIAFGVDALHFETTGVGNIALGFLAGYNVSTGNNNIEIGNLGTSADNQHRPARHRIFVRRAARSHGAARSLRAPRSHRAAGCHWPDRFNVGYTGIANPVANWSESLVLNLGSGTHTIEVMALGDNTSIDAIVSGDGNSVLQGELSVLESAQ